MEKKILVVVDMQNDFIDGSLGSEYAKNTVLPNVIKKLKSWSGYVILTRDTHSENYLKTFEGQKLPVEHCIKGTPGWNINSEIETLFNNVKDTKKKIVPKITFGDLHHMEEIINTWALPNPGNDWIIEICGLCTDICVISNALILRAAFPELEIICDASCCGGTSKEAHDAAIKVMRSCQIDIV